MQQQDPKNAFDHAELDEVIADAEAFMKTLNARRPFTRRIQDRAMRALGLNKKDYASSRNMTKNKIHVMQRTSDTGLAGLLQRDLALLGSLIAHLSMTQANDPLPGTPQYAKAVLAANHGAPAPGTFDVALLSDWQNERLIEVKGFKRLSVGMYNQAMMIAAALAAGDGRKVAYRLVGTPTINE